MTWPCSHCGTIGVRNLGTRGHCVQHLATFYRRLNPQVWDGQGIGLPDGPTAGDGWAPLRCVLCDATWSAAVFTPCPWCATATVRQREWQAELVLAAPDVEPTDARHDGAIQAWADRLEVAVAAGIVTTYQATRAWERAA